jgi:hypothetical protein
MEPYEEAYDPNLRAGCGYNLVYDADTETIDEIKAKFNAAPRVLKGPIWGLCLKWLIPRGILEPVDHVIVPMRDLDVSARSRLSVGLDWMVMDELEGEDRVRDQANVLAMVLGRTVETCWLFSLPLTFMDFPRLVKDPTYCYERLSRAFDLDQSAFIEEWSNLANPEQVMYG